MDDYLFITWDWKEPIPINQLQGAILTGHLWLYTIDQTGGDSYVIIASKRKLEPDEPQRLYSYYG